MLPNCCYCPTTTTVLQISEKWCFSFCYCSQNYYDCFCQYDDPNFGFKVDSGLYCCQKPEKQCTSQYSDITDVTCTGEALNLTQQCHNECNFYGLDANRNMYGTKRSYLNICQDNKYEFNFQPLVILLTIDDKNCILVSELVLMKLNCVWESIYVRIRMTLSGAKMNGICLLPISSILWTLS